jgi:hypothetical protein
MVEMETKEEGVAATGWAKEEAAQAPVLEGSQVGVVGEEAPAPPAREGDATAAVEPSADQAGAAAAAAAAAATTGEEEKDDDGSASSCSWGKSDEEGDADKAASAPKDDDKDDEKHRAAQLDEWRSRGARIESAITLNQIRAQLPLDTEDPSEFVPPVGWLKSAGAESPRRRLEAKWVRQAKVPDGRPMTISGRAELEELLEDERRRDGKPHLGQMTPDGRWQLRRRAVDDAILWVLGELIASGHVRSIPGDDLGKGQKSALFFACNLYVRGEAFPRRKSAKDDEDDENENEQEEELCDFELQRLRNIERNKELLRQLGLA